MAGGLIINDNVGEPFVQSIGSSGVSQMIITEGYLQPFVTIQGFSVAIQKSDLSCSDLKDGRVAVSIRSQYQHYTASYAWSSNAACPGSCSSLDSLNPGTYSVAVRITYTTSAGTVKQDSSSKTVILADPGRTCKIGIHTGFTPNGDGTNDAWIIDKITAYNTNKVSIFNRWGLEVYSAEGYDNKVKVWKPDEKTSSGTYFYIIDLNDGSKPTKGWVELINNN